MKKIVVIDNNNLLTLLIEEMCKEKYLLVRTENIIETIKYLEKKNSNVELIISEFNIKENESADLLFNRLRSSYHDKIPILVYSSYNEDRIQVEAFGGIFVLIPDEYYKLQKVVNEMI